MRALISALMLLLVPLMAAAQSAFSPAILVNGEAITFYELDQRERLLRALNTPGDVARIAREQLIEDRLKLQLTDRAGFIITAEGTQVAMEEFAARANLPLDRFLAGLAQQGVAEETLRDLVVAGVTWRDYIRQRYRREGDISDAEVDRAISSPGGTSANIEVLVSEIIMAAPPEQAAAAEARAQRISQLRDPAAFSAAAREVSLLPSRDNGGRLPWQSLSDLPPVLHPIILGLGRNEVTSPLGLPNAIALFQLRDIREGAVPARSYGSIEYATFYLPGGLSPAARQQAANIAARTDTCDDLYGEARGLPPEQLERNDLPPGEIPQDIAIELSKLDPGETSAVLTRNGGETLVFLMLCSRTPEVEAGAIDREGVRAQIRSRRLSGLADALLEELKAEAVIR